MATNFGFFKTTMPESRPADYYLGCLDGSVFIDFNNSTHNQICLVRISFDGHGCCELGDKAIPMNPSDSETFRKLIQDNISDESSLSTIIKKTLADNRKFIWEDALDEYGLSS
jgi:hypothetical protein